MNKHHKRAKLPVWLLWFIVFAGFCNTVTATGVEPQTEPDTTTKTRLVENYGKLPLSFEANRGQTDKKVQFISRGQGYGLFLTPTEAVLSLHKSEPTETKIGKSSGRALPVPAGKTHEKAVQISPDKATTLNMKLVGGNSNPQMKGLDELPGKVNYFRGKVPKQWQTNVPTYAKAKFEKVYPGIDLIYYGNQRQLEYDFIVAPGADPKAVRLSFEGADKVAVDAQGDLVLQTGGGDVRLHKPVAYQTVAGQRRNVDARFVLQNTPGARRKKLIQQIGFQVAAYDKAQTLVIDPVLAYSTYLGGSRNENGSYENWDTINHDYGDIAVDSAGNAYVTGKTHSSNFPAVNAKHPALRGYWDIFVTKFNSTGSQVLYSTYLGGSGSDYGYGIAVDRAGNATVTGKTQSADFPTVNARYPALRGSSDAFVTKFNATGSQVLYSTYLGGSSDDVGLGISVDSAGNATLTGNTHSSDYPTVNARYPALSGAFDAFVTKFNATGSQVLYSTYLGGSRGSSYGYDIAVDSAGNATVTGYTWADNFPAVNARYPAFGGGSDAFVTKFNASGSQVLYSTYLGGNIFDYGLGIAVDSAGNATVTGYTYSSDFPTVNAKYPAVRGSVDAFVTKFNATGSQVLYSTYLGGSGESHGVGIAVDSAGNAYVTGYTYSSDFPTVNAKYPTLRGPIDAFVTKFNASGSQVLYSTYLGGKFDDFGFGIAVDSAGNAYVTGNTVSSDFPTHANDVSIVSYDSSYNGGGDAFVAKITDSTPPQPVLSITPASLDFGTVTIGSSKDLPFTVKNTGAGTLTGTATAVAPFSIISGGSFSLGTAASQAVQVRFRPTATGFFAGNVSFTGNGGSTSRLVRGNGAPTPSADLSITTISTTSAYVGAKITYWLTVKNNGPGTATKVSVTDILPSGLALLPLAPPCAPSGTRVTCALGSLIKGASRVLRIDANVTNAAKSPIRNIASVRGLGPDPNTANNASVKDTTILPGIFLAVVASPAGTGRVLSVPAGIQCPGDCWESYATAPGALVTLFATPNPGYRFASWDDACSGEKAATCRLTVPISRRVVARFAKDTNTEGPVKALLLLHGMNSNAYTWNEFAKLKFGDACNRIVDGVRQGADAVNPTNGVYCYRLEFGMYDRLSGRVGLEGLTPGLAKNQGQLLAGDFSTFGQLGLEVRAAIRAILNRHPKAEIVLVGHSRGGLAARAFLQAGSPERASVVGLLTLGTPHKGTRIGRIYNYLAAKPCNSLLRVTCLSKVWWQDWNVVDILRGALTKFRSQILRVLGNTLDVRKPVIGDLADNISGAIANLNSSVRFLPTAIPYGELLYAGFDLGTLAKIQSVDVTVFCVIFKNGLSPNVCPNVSDLGQESMLGKNVAPSAYPGDGIVPWRSQRYTDIAGFPSAVPNRITRIGTASVTHTEEPEQEKDISGVLTSMRGVWWTKK